MLKCLHFSIHQIFNLFMSIKMKLSQILRFLFHKNIILQLLKMNKITYDMNDTKFSIKIQAKNKNGNFPESIGTKNKQNCLFCIDFKVEFERINKTLQF